jgi:hypothetical protein
MSGGNESNTKKHQNNNMIPCLLTMTASYLLKSTFSAVNYRQDVKRQRQTPRRVYWVPHDVGGDVIRSGDIPRCSVECYGVLLQNDLK